MVFSHNLLMGAVGQFNQAYEIDQSIRFNDNDSAYLNRTPSSAGNRRTFTFSCWVKRANLTGANQPIFTGSGDSWIMFLSAETFGINFDASGNYRIVTTQLFRDTGAWMHVVLRVDTTNSTADDRLRMYINGSQVTDFSTRTNPPLNADTDWNNTGEHNIGKLVSASQFFDGYLAEINQVDGTSLGPDSFGKTNTKGVWVPKKYTGSYGTNGFFIDGRDSSDLGDDESGNGNDFSSNGLASTDQMLDTPTLNYPTINRTFNYHTSGNTSFFQPDYSTSPLADGNLNITYNSPNTPINYCTMSLPSSGKFYFECTQTAANSLVFGIGGSKNIEEGIGASASTAMSNVIAYYSNGTLFNQNATASSYGNASSIANGEFVGVAVDIDNDAIWFCDNGTWVDGNGTASSSTVLAEIEAGTTTSAAATSFVNDQNFWFPFLGAVGDYPAATLNFGQSSFTGSAPSGFTHLNTSTLTAPTISDGSKYFQSTLYTGTGSSQAVSQSGNSTFQPDWVWIKGRSGATEHVLTDAVRGVTKELSSNDNGAEETVAQGLTTFGSAGFTVGTDGSYNTSSATYVGWQWKTQGGAGSSNEDGSINTTTTSVNQTAGISLSTYTGTGSNATVGHGLGVAPSFVLIKSRNDTHDWYVRTPALSGTEFILLNSTAAKGTASPEVWNSTAPTSSIVNIGTSIGVNRNTYNYVMYCFAEIPGYSSIGSYEGNGNADGSFVYTGFRPSWLLIKNIDATESWNLRDSSRDPFNVSKEILVPNTTAAEATSGGGQFADLLSNGFKLRGTDPGVNSSETFIYMAFAENPFGGNGIAPATAR
jgi:hypothetical protein